MTKGGEEYETLAREHIKKRKFMNQLRPPHYWNFYEDCKDVDKVPHVLRYDADPVKCYKDGRVQHIIQLIEEIGMNLQNYEEQKWKLLKKYTLEIFDKKYKTYLNALNDA